MFFDGTVCGGFNRIDQGDPKCCNQRNDDDGDRRCSKFPDWMCILRSSGADLSEKAYEEWSGDGMVVGTVIMTILGCVLNAYILLPVYAKAFEMPLDALVSMGTEVNGAITGLMTFVLFAVAPFNLLKGILVSLIVFFVYKKIRQVLL